MLTHNTHCRAETDQRILFYAFWTFDLTKLRGVEFFFHSRTQNKTISSHTLSLFFPPPQESYIIYTLQTQLCFSRISFSLFGLYNSRTHLKFHTIHQSLNILRWKHKKEYDFSSGINSFSIFSSKYLLLFVYGNFDHILILVFRLLFLLEILKVYPKVKVRTEDQDDQHALRDHNWSSLLSLKDIEFLSLHDNCFPVKQHKTVSPPVLGQPPVSYVPSIVIPTVSSPEVKEQKVVSPPPLAKIPKSYVPSVVIPPVSDSEGLDKKSNSDEEDRPNIRATSVPRPRAVMSSPDNDTVVGNKNKIKAARPSPLQNRGSVQSRHAQCKPIPAQPTKGSPLTTGKPKEPIEKRADHGGQLGSATTISSRRRKITTSKPSSVWL